MPPSLVFPREQVDLSRHPRLPIDGGRCLNAVGTLVECTEARMLAARSAELGPRFGKRLDPGEGTSLCGDSSPLSGGRVGRRGQGHWTRPFIGACPSCPRAFVRHCPELSELSGL